MRDTQGFEKKIPGKRRGFRVLILELINQYAV